jgi:hypothetical protein
VTPIYKNLQIFYRLCIQLLTRYLPINETPDRPISSHFALYMEGQIENLSLLRSAVTDLKHHITFCLWGPFIRVPIFFVPTVFVTKTYSFVLDIQSPM